VKKQASKFIGTVLLSLLVLSAPAFALDLTLLAGYQFNTDLEISTATTPISPNPEPDDKQDVELEKGASFALAVDFIFEENADQRIGFYLSHHQTDFDSNAALDTTGIDVTHLHFTAMNYYPNGNWEPFVLAGIGAAHFSPDDRSLKNVTKFSAQLAAGSNYAITEALLLRFELRWIPTFFNGSASAFCSGGCALRVKSDIYDQTQANAGLMYRF